MNSNQNDTKEETMSERIDHAGQARTALAAAAASPADASVQTDPWLLAAQVHATLALVEQQRIANLISLGSQKHDLTDGSTIRLWLFDPHSGELHDEIREGLGLS